MSAPVNLAASPGVQTLLRWIDASGVTNELTLDVVMSEDWDEGAEVSEHPVEVGANVGDHVRVKLPTCQLTIHSTNEPIGPGGPDDVAPVLTPLSLPVAAIALTQAPTSVTYPDWQNRILERALAATAGGAIGSAIGGTTGGAIGAIGVAALGELLFGGRSVNVTEQATLGLGAHDQPTVSAKTLQWSSPADFVEAYHALLVQLKNDAQLIDVHGTKQTETNMVIESLAFHRDKDTGSGEDVTIGFKKIRIVNTVTVPLPIANLSAGGGAPRVEHGQQELADAAMADTPAVAAMHLQTIAEQVNVSALPVGFTIPGLL